MDPLLVDSVASCTGYQIEVKCEASFFISDSILSILTCKVNKVLGLRFLIGMFIAAPDSLKSSAKFAIRLELENSECMDTIFFNTACGVLGL